MNKKTQEVFFENSVDMDVISENTNTFVKEIEEAGEPKQIKIEIRMANEFDPSLSIEEMADRIDQEYAKDNCKIDLLRIWKQGNRLVIVGVKL